MQQTSQLDAPVTGRLPSGPLNLITDVRGVRVGHATLARERVQTGVTVIHPHDGDAFLERTPAAATVINGFGKSVGLLQMEELGVIETPIALTNTFSVGGIATAQLRQAIAEHPDIGREWPTANPLVLECNDGYLNDIQAFAVCEADYRLACADTSTRFLQGSVGAGRGMSCFGVKGGIGSASRVADIGPGARHTVGALVLANFGRLANLTVRGKALGQMLLQREASGQQDQVDQGSIIIVLAADAPLDTRQLRRLSMRAAAGLARTGSVYGHGSGDIALAFSTAYRIPFHAAQAMPAVAMLHETQLDPLFEAAAEATEQAIVNALWAAESVIGRDGHRRRTITELMPDWREVLA
ncbi:S58 family peptidase [Pusillimonas sp. TS35]|uniref:DmpA family aminopeptidase n=1 Tax=Paracandidimonas lactea TaxID=2895524 RepID=UPI00137037E2|nr:P1 family peptidase [Paracandidimonas lactea]MYN14340.1 S58 family peptidase [Pusillimonas sp. TS35]